jgi:hypothetical protein
MNITRHNYEEYFMLYVDNELNAADRLEVESFVQQNSDLGEELVMLQQSILRPENDIVFSNKEMLLKNSSSNDLINATNCEEYFVQYGDNELTNKQKDLVEQFVYKHPQYQEEFEIIQQVKFEPENHIVFPDKSLLYRKEKDEKVVPMFFGTRTWKIAAAVVALLILAGTTLYVVNNKKNNTSELANTEPKTKTVAPADDIKKTPVTPDQRVSPTDKLAVTDKNTSTDKKAENINTASKKKENKPVINAPTVNDQPKDEHLANTAPENKIKGSSNIPMAVNVPKEENQIANDKKKGMEDLAPKKTDETSLAFNENPKISKEDPTTAIGPVPVSNKNIFSQIPDDNIDELETAGKKNKMRGFFRKVTRVFDKATNKEPSGNEKGLHIAGFAIALK